MVEQEYRSFFNFHRACDRVGERLGVIDEICALPPGKIEHSLASLFGRIDIAIGNHDGAHAHVGYVGLRKTTERCGREQTAPLGIFRGADKVAHRRFVGIHTQRLREYWAIAPRHHRFYVALDVAQQNPRGKIARFVHIDMRISFVARQHIAIRNHFFRDVGV